MALHELSVGVGLVVVEKADKSDPHYQLCEAFERLDALFSPTPLKANTDV
jgi:hypothetical protein